MASFYKFIKVINNRVYNTYKAFILLMVPDLIFIFDPIGHYSKSKSPLRLSLKTLLTHWTSSRSSQFQFPTTCQHTTSSSLRMKSRVHSMQITMMPLRSISLPS